MSPSGNIFVIFIVSIKINIIETAKKVVGNGGKVPDSIDELVEYPGVGRKVAGCVVVYAFGKNAIPVDTHVHRISNRLGLVKTTNPEKTEIELSSLNKEGVRWF